MSKIINPGDRAFYINRKRYAEVESHAKVGVEGFYFGRAIKPGFGVTREFGFRAPNPNLITNLGLDAIGGEVFASRMHLGTGTTPAQITDTALANFGVNVSSTNPGLSDFGVSGSAPHYGWIRLTWTSAVGGAAGNWTEIGISNQNGNGNLRSRALILDGGGSPTAFPVLPDEQFQGTYEIRIYAPSADSLESVSLSGSPYDTVTRALRVTSAAGNGGWAPQGVLSSTPWFGAITSGNQGTAYSGGLGSVTDNNPGGSSLGNRTSAQVSGYTGGNHYLDSSWRWGSGAGVGLIRTFLLPLNCGTVQVEYDPAINKATDEEVIINQRVHWDRA